MNKNDKNNQQAILIFEVAENIVRRWLRQTYNIYAEFESDNHVQDENSISYTRSLYTDCDGITYEVKLGIVPAEYSIDFKQFHSNKDKSIILEMAGFLIYAVKVVFSSILKSLNSKEFNDIGLKFDEQSNTFYAEYIHDYIIQKDHLEKCVSKLLISDDRNTEWHTNWAITIAKYDDIEKKIKAENIYEFIATRNQTYKSSPRIGLIICKIPKEKQV